MTKGCPVEHGMLPLYHTYFLIGIVFSMTDFFEIHLASLSMKSTIASIQIKALRRENEALLTAENNS
jgi:hypothetical protein